MLAVGTAALLPLRLLGRVMELPVAPVVGAMTSLALRLLGRVMDALPAVPWIGALLPLGRPIGVPAFVLAPDGGKIGAAVLWGVVL